MVKMTETAKAYRGTMVNDAVVTMQSHVPTKGQAMMSTQAAIEIHSVLRVSNALARSLVRASSGSTWNLLNSRGPVEKCMKDNGIDTRNVHEVVLVGGFVHAPRSSTWTTSETQWAPLKSA